MCGVTVKCDGKSAMFWGTVNCYVQLTRLCKLSKDCSDKRNPLKYCNF